MSQSFKGDPVKHLTEMGLPIDEAERLSAEIETDNTLLARNFCETFTSQRQSALPWRMI